MSRSSRNLLLAAASLCLVIVVNATGGPTCPRCTRDMGKLPGSKCPCRYLEDSPSADSSSSGDSTAGAKPTKCTCIGSTPQHDCVACVNSEKAAELATMIRQHGNEALGGTDR